MHEDVRIRLVGKVPLDRFVGAVGVADENLKALLDHRVETTPDLGGKPRERAILKYLKIETLAMAKGEAIPRHAKPRLGAE